MNLIETYQFKPMALNHLYSGATQTLEDSYYLRNIFFEFLSI